MTPAERDLRAVGVRALLADQNIKDAFDSIDKDLKDEWAAARTPEERERLWLAVNVMERLKTWLQSAASGDLTAMKRAK
jgi:hypothetical protein